MTICHKHDCAHDGTCQACNLEDELREVKSNLDAAHSKIFEMENRLSEINRFAKWCNYLLDVMQL